ncbi:hypothetical protein [Methylocystis iwaonis]|uniref:Methyltransferase FkbM domain-containing protein n=1 Tax=Methylocystis iwaonis TaxID=2885079 RepID=A0ABN6VKX3_9HYPH|nr:hypothetical protein [Methylocystis iwaonis]BDV36184.1 hypothetical protein SS37A_37140 [Methylocystis iwaonis]
MNPLVEALALLTPFDIDRRKVRIGPETDGGYVFVDHIDPSQTILSYGISFEYRFDAEMAARGHRVYMFDHTIDGINATHPNMLYYKEGVAGVSSPEQCLYSIEDHLARFGIEGDRLILKMDVEGAEWDAIGMTPDTVLARFEQIVIEVHGVNAITDTGYREKFCFFFRKLNRLFTLFHVHANNCDGPNGLTIVSGIPVSPLLELSYVRNNVCNKFPSRTLYPTALDFPNVGAKDKLLWFFPFLPTFCSVDDFALCEERAELQERLRLSSAGRL